MVALLPTFAQTHKDIEPLLNQVHHADAFDLLARIPDKSVDMVLADLPYNSLKHIEWENAFDLPRMWSHIKRILKPQCVAVFTASQPFTSLLTTSNLSWFRHEWIWRKSLGTGYLNANRQPMKNHEVVLVFAEGSHKYYPQMREGEPYAHTSGSVGGFVKDKSVGGYSTINEGLRYPLTVIDFASASNTVHPTQKPVALFEYLIKTYTKENEIVLDMVSGSGTTAIAARKCNRQFICGDFTLEYVEASRKRLQETDPYQDTELSNGQKQLSLFADMPSNMEIVERQADGFMMKVKV
jgi:site-specific DNA-methyltransferase (adenine-specific)